MSDWSQRTIKIETVNGRKPIAADCYGDYAVHSTTRRGGVITGDYTITHSSSGLALVHGIAETSARRTVELFVAALTKHSLAIRVKAGRWSATKRIRTLFDRAYQEAMNEYRHV